MQEPFDWEQAMETTRRSATAASQNSEHAVAGMAKLLREIDNHSRKISSLSRTIDQLETAQAQQSLHYKDFLNRAQIEDRNSPRLLAWGLFFAFAVGVSFGGFFMS